MQIHDIAFTSSCRSLAIIIFFLPSPGAIITNTFLQWYVNEQTEEERLARECNDKPEQICDDKSGLYLFDRNILTMDATRERKGYGN